MNKNINIVWCDDQIDLLIDEIQEILNDHNCSVIKTKTAQEMINVLKENQNLIDAVIVDFNLGQRNAIPDREQADGFRYIHERREDYPHIPFYLCSGRDWDFIERIYGELQFTTDNDYFFCENENVVDGGQRYFQKNQIPALLDMLVEEVNTINTRSYKIRQEYFEAFEAIKKFGLNEDLFVKLLSLPNNSQNVDNYPNQLRCELDALFGKLHKEDIYPDSKTNRNSILKCIEISNQKDNKLFTGIVNYLVPILQDGSHNGEEAYVKKCLQEYNDLYIVKTLTIMCLDLIKWFNCFYEENKEKKPFKFESFIAELQFDSTNNIWFVSHNATKYHLQEDNTIIHFSAQLKVKITGHKGKNSKIENDNYLFVPKQKWELAY